MAPAADVDTPERPQRLGQPACGLTTAPTGQGAIINGEQGFCQEGIESEAFETAEEPLTAVEGGDVGTVDPLAGAAVAAGQVPGSQSRSGLPAGIDVDGSDPNPVRGDGACTHATAPCPNRAVEDGGRSRPRPPRWIGRFGRGQWGGARLPFNDFAEGAM